MYGIKKDSSVEEIDDLIDEYKHAKSAALRDPELKDDEISIEREILSHAAHLGKFFEGRL